MNRHARRVWATKVALQPAGALVAHGGIRLDLLRTCLAGIGWRNDHNRQHSSQGHRTSAIPKNGGGRTLAVGRTRGGLNSKLHLICDGLGRLLTFFLLAGPDGEAKGALVLMDALLPATVLLGEKAIMPTGCVKDLKTRGLPSASRPGVGSGMLPAMIGNSTSSATRSSVCLPV